VKAAYTRIVMHDSKHMSQHVNKSVCSLPNIMYALHLYTSSACVTTWAEGQWH